MIENRHFRRTLTRESRGTVAIAHRASPSLFLLLIGFLALLQASVAQTHIHILAGPARAAVTLLAPGSAPAAGITAPVVGEQAVPLRDPYPPADDPANCPLCQEVAHLGQMLHSVAILMAPLYAELSRFDPPVVCCQFHSAAPHFWHSRAPPSL